MGATDRMTIVPGLSVLQSELLNPDVNLKICRLPEVFSRLVLPNTRKCSGSPFGLNWVLRTESPQVCFAVSSGEVVRFLISGNTALSPAWLKFIELLLAGI